jgi:hypothetical protein
MIRNNIFTKTKVKKKNRKRKMKGNESQTTCMDCSREKIQRRTLRFQKKRRFPCLSFLGNQTDTTAREITKKEEERERVPDQQTHS